MSRASGSSAGSGAPFEPPFAELEDFAAEPLDWPAVRALFERHAYSSLGRRALVELKPRSAAGARAALARCAELIVLAEAGPHAVPPLAGISDPLPILAGARAYSRPFDEDEFRILAVFLRATGKLARWISVRHVELPANLRLFEHLPELGFLGESLDASLDDRGRVLDDASPRLAELRRDIGRLSDEIERVVRRIGGGAELRQTFAEGQRGRVHRRGGRPCLALRARERRKLRGIVHDRSQSGETMFIEPEEVVESGNRLASLQAAENHEVGRILTELTRLVLEHEPELERAVRVVAELELAMIAVLFAAEYDARTIDDDLLGRERRADGERGLLLRRMRHPLLLAKQRLGELDECVPIDLRLGDDFDLVVITGPNTGGKTLALKSAGLAALLVRLGLPVPCDKGSRIPFYEGVFADIGDEQEVEQNLSTFSSHLQRVRAALEGRELDGAGGGRRALCAGPTTLTLIDELGGGTDPDEGAALGEAVLEELLSRGAPALVSTHLGRLKEVAYRHARAENASTEFDLESLAPRFVLTLGTPGESRALAIAKRLGLDAGLLERAAELLERSTGAGVERDALFADLTNTRLELESLRTRAEDKLGEVTSAQAALEEARASQAREAKLLVKEAQQGLEQRLRDCKGYLERAAQLLPRIGKDVRGELEEQLAALSDTLTGATLDDARRAFLEGLKKGDHVWVPRYRRRCQITRVHKAKQRVVVRFGKQDLDVGFEEISTYDTL